MRRTGNDHAHARMLLGAFLLGGLSSHEAAAVRAHLDVCLECRTEYDYLACVPSWLDLVRGQAADEARLTGDTGRGMMWPVLHVVDPGPTA
jgi:predicted anti-sigma-YlaC factor YlaD